MVLSGLVSSSVNSGTRTETGLGLSGMSIKLPRSATFLGVTEHGDANREDSSSFSSFES